MLGLHLSCRLGAVGGGPGSAAHRLGRGVAGTGAQGEGDVLAEYVTPGIEEVITHGNAVGHILDQHFDAAGAHVPTPLSPRTLALSLEALRDIPLVIGIACGSEKVDAIIAAARGGTLNGLVTDAYTATLILGRLDAGGA